MGLPGRAQSRSRGGAPLARLSRPTCGAPALPQARPHSGAALPARPAQRGVPPASSHRQVRVAAVAVGHGSDDPRPPAAPAAALPALGTRVLAGRHAQEPLSHQLRPRLHRHGRRCAGNKRGPLLPAAHAEEPTAGEAVRKRERPCTLGDLEPRHPRPHARPTGKLTGMCARPRRRPVPLRPPGRAACPSAGGGAGVGGRRQVVPPTGCAADPSGGSRGTAARQLLQLRLRPLGGASAGTGLGSHARSLNQLREVRMSGATAVRTHSAVVKEPESPRGPGPAALPTPPRPLGGPRL